MLAVTHRGTPLRRYVDAAAAAAAGGELEKTIGNQAPAEAYSFIR